jgi:type IV pilus assembly protein PilM
MSGLLRQGRVAKRPDEAGLVGRPASAGRRGAQVLASWLASPPPDAAVEIAPSRVSAASLTRRGGAVAVQAYAVESLPADAVSPSLAAHNIVNRPAVAAAVRTVLDRLGSRPARVALIIPDVSAKVSLVRFDQIPSRRDDLDQLVRWQVRKSAPFAIDDACVSYTPGARSGTGGELVVVLARRDIVREYEDVCADAGVHAGLVDLATFSVLNLLLAAPNVPDGDWLAVHMRPEYTSIAIVRGSDLIFFRNRPEGDEASLADVVHQTAMYYQDRLSGQGFVRVLLGGSGRAAGAIDQARRSLEERLGSVVDPIDPTAAVTLSDRIGVTADLMDILAPLTGMLLRN